MATVAPHRHAQRRGTAAEWASVNPVLADGETGYETDTDQFKMGNGTTIWTDLPYMARGPKGTDSTVPGPRGFGVPDPAGQPAGAMIRLDGSEVSEWFDPTPATPAAPDVQDFTSSGTWTKPAGAVRVDAEMISGGGGQYGGGGGYMKISVKADFLSASVSVVVGAGGVGNGVGGASSFGLHAVPGGGGYPGGDGGDGGGYGGGLGSHAIDSGDGVSGYYGGGGGGGSGSAIGGDSAYGGGGGGDTTGGKGGASLDPEALLGGDGGGQSQDGIAPGGGGGKGKNGARGQVRVTTFFE